MTAYADAVAEALLRLRTVGYEHGPSFANHAPMAAEALARLGFTEDVPAWVERNLRTRRYHEAPRARFPLAAGDEAGWRSALGDFRRIRDWQALFERELAGDRPWREVLAEWWPRLLPGRSGALTHGIIRTAHAVRALADSGVNGADQRVELARGLGYWAARYAGAPAPAGDRPESATEADALVAKAELEGLVVAGADYYTSLRPSFPVPLVHLITAPAAVRLLADHLPADLLRPSYLATQRCVASIRGYFGGSLAELPAAGHDRTPDPESVVAEAVELGDEHAIKLAEVATRFAGRPGGERVLAASRMATRLISRNPV